VPSLFRHHDEPPDHARSPLYRQLTGEWVALNANTAVAITMRRWDRTEPSLTGYTRPADVVDAIDQASPDDKDDLLASLVRLFQAGHQLAGRVLLQAMLPKLARLASQMVPRSSDTIRLEDRQHIVIAEFWQVLSTYPIRRRPRTVAGGLTLDTLHRITGTRSGPADIPVAPADLDAARSREPTPTVADGPDQTDLDHVLSWAVEQKVIAAETARLLRTVYLDDDGRRNCGFDTAAAQWGLSPTAVRQRCSRAVRALTTAVRLEASGQQARQAAS
jgi:hypothetical protein